jgi:3-oxoacyl-[acyl-carrier-protein] synthase-3
MAARVRRADHQIGVKIAGTGHYLPGPPIDCDGVRERLRRWPDSLPERIQDRLLEESGIRTRHFGISLDESTPRETNTSMATAAGTRALTAAGWKPADVDLLVVTTVVPDQLIPPTSTLVQEALGIRACAELEISANCTAPYKGLLAAANQLRLGQSRRALVCSSQFVSFLGIPPWANPAKMTPSQAQLRWLLSDGAGAVALEASEADCGLAVWTESTGSGRASGMEIALGAAHADLASAWSAGHQHVVQTVRRLREDGLRDGLDALTRMLRGLEIAPDAIDHFIPEIPALPFADLGKPLLADALSLRPSAWRVHLDTIGNVGGATLPIVLDRMVRGRELHPGDLVVSFAEESSKWMFAGAAFRWD